MAIYIPNAYKPYEDPMVSTLRSSLGNIGQGLAGLAHHKVKEMQHNKLSNLFQQTGYDAPTSQLLAQIYHEGGPENFHKTLGLLGGQQAPQEAIQSQPQQQGPGAGEEVAQMQQPKGVSLQGALANRSRNNVQVNVGGLTPAQEQAKLKLEPSLTYLNDLERTINDLKELTESGNVNFGIGSNLLSQLPFEAGNTFLNKETGSYDALAKKFAIEKEASGKGVGSAYKLKVIEKSKPGLNRTKEQNEYLLDKELRNVKEKKRELLKAYPFLNQENESELAEFAAEKNEGPMGMTVKKGDKIFKWSPEDQDYTIELKRKGS